MQLQALRTQLHPHFLFNTLNAIATVVHRDPEAADQMIARLSDLLRLTLEGIGVQEVSPAQEIDFLRGYLEIEQARFGHRLTVDMQIAPEVLGARIPYLILQPLVENAIRHGVAPRSQPGRVVIRAESDNGFLVLEVRDNGPGLAAGFDTPTRRGMGLSNTRSRLEKLYGERQRFEAKNGSNGGCVVTLTSPFQPASATDGDAQDTGSRFLRVRRPGTTWPTLTKPRETVLASLFHNPPTSLVASAPEFSGNHRIRLAHFRLSSPRQRFLCVPGAARAVDQKTGSRICSFCDLVDVSEYLQERAEIDSDGLYVTLAHTSTVTT
ncbi:MAG TPA: histidine kinase [Terriglobales bacterium]|nr:histidine kinase [Terriglobales bacterium]